MGDVLKAYFVPNGSYLMEMAEDGDAVSAVETLQSIGREIRTALRPDAVVVASPHWLPKSAFFVDDGARHESFNDYPLRPAPFGRRFFSYTAAGDPVLARAIVAAAREEGLPAATKAYGLDHGAFCPLKVMDLGGILTVPISTSRRGFDECVRWGAAVRRAAQATGRRVVVVAPGNLTHRLDLRGDDEREAYYAPGARFDKIMIDLVTSGRSLDIQKIDPDLLREAAPEADARPLYFLAGLTGNAPGRLLQYQGMKYSVGDATFEFDPVELPGGFSRSAPASPGRDERPGGLGGHVGAPHAITPAAFIYDALRKVAVARGVAADGQPWILELRDRAADDSMTVVLRGPGGSERTLTLTDADFVFGDDRVCLRPAPEITWRMEPLSMKKLRGFTRGNIPTPDIPGPSLP